MPPTSTRFRTVRLALGNRAEIVLNGDGTFPGLWEDLRSVRRYITLQL